MNNNNSALSQEIRDVLKIQVGKDGIPSQVQQYIVPVIDVNPKHAIITSFIASGGGTGTVTLTTTPTNRDFYLTAYSLFTSNTALTSATFARIDCVIGGAVKIIHVLGITPSVVNTASGNQVLRFPIKVDRGSAIRITSDATTGGSFASIQGYIDDNSGA